MDIQEIQFILREAGEFISDFGEEVNDLEIDVLKDSLSVRLRQTISPQSGKLGYSLEERLKERMRSNFGDLIEDLIKPADQAQAQTEISQLIGNVGSFINTDIVDGLMNSSPHASLIKGAVNVVGGIASSIFQSHRNKMKAEIAESIMQAQVQLHQDMLPNIAFYSAMSDLDNEYANGIQHIKTQNERLQSNLLTLCTSINSLLKRLNKGVDTENNLALVATQIGLALKDIAQNSTEEQAGILSRLVNFLHFNTQQLYSQFIEISEMQMRLNTEFQAKFRKIILDYKDHCKFENAETTVLELDTHRKELNQKILERHQNNKAKFQNRIEHIYFPPMV